MAARTRTRPKYAGRCWPKCCAKVSRPNSPARRLGVKSQAVSLPFDRRQLCTVHVIDEDAHRIDWCHPKRIQLQLDQGPIEAQFKLAIAARDGSSS